MKNVFFLRGFLVHLENKNIVHFEHLVFNGFCDAITRKAIRKDISVSFGLGLSNITLGSLFPIRFYWEKKDILLIFS